MDRNLERYVRKIWYDEPGKLKENIRDGWSEIWEVKIEGAWGDPCETMRELDPWPINCEVQGGP